MFLCDRLECLLLSFFLFFMYCLFFVFLFMSCYFLLLLLVFHLLFLCLLGVHFSLPSPRIIVSPMNMCVYTCVIHDVHVYIDAVRLRHSSTCWTWSSLFEISFSLSLALICFIKYGFFFCLLFVWCKTRLARHFILYVGNHFVSQNKFVLFIDCSW